MVEKNRTFNINFIYRFWTSCAATSLYTDISSSTNLSLICSHITTQEFEKLHFGDDNQYIVKAQKLVKMHSF